MTTGPLHWELLQKARLGVFCFVNCNAHGSDMRIVP